MNAASPSHRPKLDGPRRRDKLRERIQRSWPIWQWNLHKIRGSLRLRPPSPIFIQRPAVVPGTVVANVENGPNVRQQPIVHSRVTQVHKPVRDYGRKDREEIYKEVADESEPAQSQGIKATDSSARLRRLVTLASTHSRGDPSELKASIEGAFVRSKGATDPGMLIICHTVLKSICHYDAVLNEILQQDGQKLDRESAEACAKFVCDRPAREIFAILVCIDQVPLIWNFKELNIGDSDLPFTVDGGKTGDDYLRRRSSQLRNGHDTNPEDGVASQPSLVFFEGNRMRERRRAFYDAQWKVCVPFLAKKDGRPQHFEFDAQARMPWSDFDKKTKEGGYGHVNEIRIYDSQHRLGPDTMSFALKVLQGQGVGPRAGFEDEDGALRRLPKSDHIIELLATIEQGEKRMFLFPWAKGGTLEDFWTGHASAHVTPNRRRPDLCMKWIAKQFAGIAAVLHDMHYRAKQSDGMSVADNKDLDRAESESQLSHVSRPESPSVLRYRSPRSVPRFCYHGDLKPDNILFFPQSDRQNQQADIGTLKLADFGLARVFRETSRTMQQKSRGNFLYRPPEHDWSQPQDSPSIDIWALGCILCELLSWVFLGPDSVKDFTKDRSKETGRLTGRWYDDHFFKMVTSGFSDPEGSAPAAGRATRQGMSDHSGGAFKLRDAVVNRIRKLKKVAVGGRDGSFVVQFLDFIQKHMLDLRPETRAQAFHVQEFLTAALENPDEDYWKCNAL